MRFTHVKNKRKQGFQGGRDGMHRRRRDTVEFADLFGKDVGAVTPEMLESTIRRGSRSGALTKPSYSFPTAEVLHRDLRAEIPPALHEPALSNFGLQEGIHCGRVG